VRRRSNLQLVGFTERYITLEHAGYARRGKAGR